MCIMSNASRRGVAAASNFQLVRRYVVLEQLLLQDEHDSRECTALYSGSKFMGLNPKDQKIVSMREQHSLYRGFTTHFRKPTTAALLRGSPFMDRMNSRLSVRKKSVTPGSSAPNQRHFAAPSRQSGESQDSSRQWCAGGKVSQADFAQQWKDLLGECQSM